MSAGKEKRTLRLGERRLATGDWKMTTRGKRATSGGLEGGGVQVRTDSVPPGPGFARSLST